jgi:hypothetical protein
MIRNIKIYINLEIHYELIGKKLIMPMIRFPVGAQAEPPNAIVGIGRILFL